MMMNEFKMTDLGEMKYFLGLEIEQKENGIFVHPKKYAEDMLKKFHMEDCTGIGTPMENQLKLEETRDGEQYNPTHYRSMIGSLMYLTASRPDIVFSVNLLSCHNHNPSSAHAMYVRRILKYVKATVSYGIWNRQADEVNLSVFSDASYGTGENCSSRTGYCCTLGSGVFAWCSKKQRVIAQSSAEAEYVAVNYTAKQAQWVKKVLFKLRELKDPCVTIYCDSSSAIAMAENPTDHMRTKHMKIKYHYVRDLVEEKEIQLKYCKTLYQLADFFTKSLSRSRFDELRHLIGMQAGMNQGGDVGSGDSHHLAVNKALLCRKVKSDERKAKKKERPAGKKISKMIKAKSVEKLVMKVFEGVLSRLEAKEFTKQGLIAGLPCESPGKAS